MADPPFERPLGDRIGADSELVRSLASLEAGPAGRKGRHDRPGRSELIGEVEMIDRNAAVIEQRPLDEALPQHLYEEVRSEEHTSELQSLMRISYAVFCLKKKTRTNK